MSDRELLELAAKAAGMLVLRDGERPPDDRKYWFFNQVGSNPPALYDAGVPALTMWAPLTDDGDALRLAAKLELDVMHRVVSGRRVETLAAGGPVMQHFYEGDTATAMRRAIVLAAAEIGRRK